MNKMLIAVAVAALTLVPAPAHATTPSLGDLLNQVTVVPAIDHHPGYQRSCREGEGCVFGPAWNDPNDHSGCDTRSRVLAAQLSDVTFMEGHGCKIASGTLVDPYSGQTIEYRRGDRSSVQIDHIVPLALAWDAGAYAWPQSRRVAFANDTDELLAVSGKENEAKGDLSIGRWLPPNRAFDCSYIQLYLAVAVKYQLPITTADGDTARSCV
jgi:hypothetical protein